MGQVAMDNYRIRFTRQELLELARALMLIQDEDASADVNMEPEAVKAKKSAEEKICRAAGWETRDQRNERESKLPSIDVMDLRAGKVPRG